MSWNITDRFPSWGESGESPPDGFFYEGEDQVNEKHLDYLWNSIKGLEDDTQAALNDIDSNEDGTVDEADSALTYKGNDIDSDGDGIVNEADSIPSLESISEITFLASGTTTVSADSSALVLNATEVDTSNGEVVIGNAHTLNGSASVYGIEDNTDVPFNEGDVGWGIVDRSSTEVRLSVINDSPASQDIRYGFWKVIP